MSNEYAELNNKLDQVLEIVTANGQGIEVISERLDALEKIIKRFCEIE